MQLSGNSKFDLFATLVLYIGYGLLVVMSCENIFFWDTVQLGAKHGLYFFDTNFGSLLLPDEIDSGHVPIFGAYLALSWKVFGKSLLISHLAMLPIVLLLVNQIIKLSKSIVNPEYAMVLACLICADPTLIAQCTLISPDVLLMTAFIGAVRCIYIGENNLSKYLFFILLALVSMRGVMLLAVLFVWDCYLLYQDNKRKMSIAYLFPYASAACPFVFYMFWHYLEKGWIGYHGLSPWAPSFERVGLEGFLKNIGLMVWRIGDYGRWPFLFLLVIFFVKRSKKDFFNTWTVLLVLVTLGIGYSFVAYSGLQGHRYLMPVYVLLTIVVFRYLIAQKKTYFVLLTIMLSLVTGHAWLYPRGISQGWDASLAHSPYFDLWTQAREYIDAQSIDYNLIGTAFPNINTIRSLTLVDSEATFTPMEIGKSKYLLLSSVMNDVKENDLKSIRQVYNLERQWYKGGVVMQFWTLK
jgi:hypothetical protein